MPMSTPQHPRLALDLDILYGLDQDLKMSIDAVAVGALIHLVGEPLRREVVTSMILMR